MKKIFLQLLLFATTISVYGTDLDTKPDTVYVQTLDDDGEWGYSSRTYYKYNDDGSIKEVVYADWSVFYNDWVNNDKYIYSSSESPKMERTEKYSWSKINNDWKLTYDNMVEYDSDGNVLVSSGRTGRTEYAYENGLKIKEIVLSKDDEVDEWDTVKAKYWKYDENGNILEHKTPYSTKIYTYENEKLVKFEQFSSANVLDEVKTYSYSNDTVFVTKTYMFDNEEFSSFYIVDEKGRVKTEFNKLLYAPWFKLLIDSTTVHYTYNEAGLLEKTSYEILNEETNESVVVGEIVKNYYENGSLKDSINYYFDSTYNSLVKTDEQRFDNEGNVAYRLYTSKHKGQMYDSTMVQYAGYKHIMREQYRWNEEKQALVGYDYYFKSEEEGNNDVYYSYKWDNESDDWELVSKRIIVYDEYGYKKEEYMERLDEDTEEWTKTNDIRYINIYPNQHVTGLQETDINVKLFPTIAINNITISSESVDEMLGMKIINTHGQIVCFFSVFQNELDITDWSQGKYYILFETKNGRITKCFVKK